MLAVSLNIAKSAELHKINEFDEINPMLASNDTKAPPATEKPELNGGAN